MKVSGFPLFQYVKDRGGGSPVPGSSRSRVPDSGGYVIRRCKSMRILNPSCHGDKPGATERRTVSWHGVMIFVVPGLIRFVRVVPVDTFFEAAVDVLPGDAGVLSPGDVGGLVGFEQGFADITQEEVGERGGIFEGRAVNAWEHGSVRADVGVIAAEDDAFKLVATSECSYSYARHPLRQVDV